ncbi:MAG TPA: hypothetical protein VK348_03860 [Planctomycetota bacterium]|nr:hypothetical protein [Planctomycetota bacterium]
MRALLSVLLFVDALARCQVFIVDIHNGPGTSFTSISAAVAAVPPGAILEVRPGSYVETVTIDAKALAILGAGNSGANIVAVSDIRVQNTQASQPVTVHGLTVGTATSTNCAGQTTWDEVRVDWDWGCSGCAQLVLNRSTLKLSAPAANCSAVAEACDFSGQQGCYDPGLCNIPPTPGLTLDHGSFVLRGCSVQAGIWIAPPGSVVFAVEGLRLVGGSVKLLDCRVAASNGLAFNGAVNGTGTMRADAASTFTPFYSFVTPPPVIGPMPRVSSAGAVLGNTITVDVDGVPGELAVLLIGMAGPPLVIPGFADAFWLAPMDYHFHAIGSVPMTTGVAVPTDPSLRGLRIGWQAVTFDGAGNSKVSNPSLDLVL